MDIAFRKALIVMTMMLSTTIQADLVPYLALRSQGINGAREMVGWQTHINRFDMDQNYGSFSITPEFSRSFKHKKLAAALFCDALSSHEYSSTNSCCTCTCPHIKIQGSKVVARDPQALMAENFYLPTDYSSTVAFEPTINNVIVDFNLYYGFDEWLEGLYLRIHAPLCHTRWHLNMCERIKNPGSAAYDVGYFNNTFSPADFTNPKVHGLPRSSMLSSFTEFIYAGNSINGVPGISYEGLGFARMNTRSLSATRLAEVTAALGYNFLLEEDYYWGLNIRAAAPTGNSPEARWLFEPIVGNGHHWELGIGMDSRYCIWRTQEEDRDVTLYLDATLTHLFDTTQIRTFDLHCKPLSRYMLATKFTPSVNNLIVGQTAPNAQCANVFTPVANLTTAPCSVHAAVQGEVTFKIAYTWNNLQWDTGYNFWGRSHLHIKRHGSCTNFTDNTWGLKGDAFMYGFPTTYNPLAVSPNGVPLSATEHNASIFEGTNRPYDIRFVQPTTKENETWNMNLGVDNPGTAFNNAHVELATHTIDDADPVSGTALWLETQSSHLPRYISEDDIDVQGAETNSYSNKLFMHFSYTWQEIADYAPYFGGGGEMEFGSQSACCCSSHNRASCAAHTCQLTGNCYAKPSHTVSLTQWGIWLKAGLSFK
jgi:hypothetical protein